MNYKINAEKAFVDSADGEMVALILETGVYYTFSNMATALIKDLDAGFSLEVVSDKISDMTGGAVTKEQVLIFTNNLVSADIMAEVPAKTIDPDIELESGKVQDDFYLEMNSFSDVADFFKIDPIHEVDPTVGWKLGNPNQ